MDYPLRLVPNVHHGLIVGDLDHLSFDDVTLINCREGLGLHIRLLGFCRLGLGCFSRGLPGCSHILYCSFLTFGCHLLIGSFLHLSSFLCSGGFLLLRLNLNLTVLLNFFFV